MGFRAKKFYEGNDSIGKLIHDFRVTNPDEIYFDEIAEPVQYLKETKEGKEKVISVLDEIRMEERIAGFLESINKFNIDTAKRMIKNELPSETILDLLPGLNLDTLNSLREELQ